MQQKPVEFKKIYEHNMDFLIMEEFISDRGFARIFLDKFQLPDNYVVHKVAHSLSDSDGESDIAVVLQYPGRKVAILMEDKIDAQTMQEQSLRYGKRAQKAEERGEYDAHFVVLVAPEDYHKEHRNDPNASYSYRVTYEEMREYLGRQNSPRAMFKTAMIDFAVQEKKAGYQVQEVPAVTAFWSKLRQYCKEYFPHLCMVGTDTPKGASACWPEFRTTLGTVKVIYKSQKGWVDLEFPQYGDRVAELRLLIQDKMTADMQIWPTGKSASVRLGEDRWKVEFTQDFEHCKAEIAEVLQAVSDLCGLASKINYSELY